MRTALCLLLLASALEGQGKRRLHSRAAFALLDSVALDDSSDMRPLDPHARFDSLMLDMVAHLDSVYGARLGHATRIRRWDEFSTQAHPSAGILVDRLEIDQLVEKLGREKQLGGIPPEEIYKRVGHVVQFVVAHEYAHLIQYAFLPRDSVDAPQLTRIIECAADIQGGAMHRAYVAQRYKDFATRDGALGATTHFGWLIGSPSWLDGTSHPEPAQRTLCIHAGQNAQIEDIEQLLAWSLARAREITQRPDAVAAVDNRRAVTVDDSVMTFVRQVASLAARGPTVMLRELRGPKLLGDSLYVSRRSLPEPWKCIVRGTASLATLRCEIVQNSAGSDFDRIALSTRYALSQTSWEPDWNAARRTIALQSASRADGMSIRRNGRERARVQVTASEDRNTMAAQMPAQSRLVFEVTAKR